MDERFLKEEGLEVFTGNELLLKGALEAEVALITGYPGSPISDLFEAASANRELLLRHGIVADIANNEALAVARLNGSRMAGVRAMAAMKSVGLHVAADGLALGNLAEPRNAGGAVIVVGDDPWIDSTQINNDSRYLSQHLHMPVLEPSTFQELKDWVGTAFELSSAADLYITFLITTHQADGGGTVWVRPNKYPAVNRRQPVAVETSKIDLDHNVLLPPRTWAREASLAPRFERLIEAARSHRLNVLVNPDAARSAIGFIASGLSYAYLEHACAELGISGRYPILKLGLTYPVDPEAVISLAAQVKDIYVVEEKRGFVETQVIQILNQARQDGRLSTIPNVWGKRFAGGKVGFPELRGLNVSILIDKLREVGPGLATVPASADAFKTLPVLPIRTPTFCPGCPHRDSSSVFLDIKRDFMDPMYMQRTHRRSPVDLVFHGETGCFTMLMFEPNEALMHNYSGMGLGGGTGAGADPFISNKQVVFLGDSTFFHSGMLAISDSLKAGQDITYVILDNKTTAMTGHQPTPATDVSLLGEKTFAQNIEDIVRGMTRQTLPVKRANPEAREAYRDLLEGMILEDGVKVIIADKECGLTYHRRKRKTEAEVIRRDGFLAEERHINITPEVCEYCLECTKATACPGLAVEETAYGPKIVTDLTDCVSDGACARVKACPSFEEIIITRKSAPARLPLPSLDQLPEVILPPLGGRWHAYTAGVGGLGSGVLTAVLVQAAHRQGYRVLFSDKRGLAVRNGSVTGHVLITNEGGTLAPLVPAGKADLILGLDALEAARSLGPAFRIADKERTAAVVDGAEHLTVRMRLGKDQPALQTAEEVLRAGTRSYWRTDLSSLAESYFGTRRYTNLMLLGAAYQLGWVPLLADHLEWAIEQSVSKEDREPNITAFRAGRAAAAVPGLFAAAPTAPANFSALLTEKVRSLEKTDGDELARAYRHLTQETVLELHLNDAAHCQLAQRLFDLVHYEDLALARRYADLVLQTHARDRAQWNYEATRAVICNAFKVMAIKDEVYVAHLLTSPEKRARDRQRYGINASRGDKVRYRHFNRPELLFGKHAWRRDMVTSDWQLGLVKKLKFLRRLWPGWHRDEQVFRDWYLALVNRFEAETEEDYRRWVEILRSPEEVRGYREIRTPGMMGARRKVETLLAQLQPFAKSPHARQPVDS